MIYHTSVLSPTFKWNGWKCWLRRNYNLLFVKDTSISKRTSFLVYAKPLTICKRNIIIIVCETILAEVREHMFSSLDVWRNSSRYRGPIWMTSSSLPWWRHQMEIFSASLAICSGNSPVTGEFPAPRPVTQSFDVFFDRRLNKRLSKQWRGWWFQTPQ